MSLIFCWTFCVFFLSSDFILLYVLVIVKILSCSDWPFLLASLRMQNTFLGVLTPPTPPPPAGSNSHLRAGTKEEPCGKEGNSPPLPQEQEGSYSPDPSSGTRLMRVAVSLAPPVGPGRPRHQSHPCRKLAQHGQPDTTHGQA